MVMATMVAMVLTPANYEDTVKQQKSIIIREYNFVFRGVGV